MAIEDIKGKELTVELSYRCPLKCIHCSSVGIPGELTRLKIFDSIEKIKPDFLRISGGEPLVHDLNNLGVFESGLKIIMQTTGIGETSYLSDYDIELVRFSVYGDKSFHNNITQKCSYDATIKAVEDCINQSNSEVQLTTPIFGEEPLNDVINLAENLGISVRIAKLLSHGRAKNIPDLILSDNEQKDIASKYIGHPSVIVTDSLLEPRVCNLKSKFTLLPNGETKSCVAGKHGKHGCNKNKICWGI